ncbi:MAG: hypothetical protein WD118_01380 [Phycisphaeraceae bacterium]
MSQISEGATSFIDVAGGNTEAWVQSVRSLMPASTDIRANHPWLTQSGTRQSTAAAASPFDLR